MDYPIRRRARRLPFGSDTKQMVAEAVGRLRVKQGLEDVLVLRDRVREFGERVDLFPGGLLIEADGSVAGVADGGHRQVLLVARRAVLFADVPAERLARSGRARLQCRQRLLGPSDYTRIIEVIGKSALWRGDFFRERRLLAPAATRASTIAVWPRFSAISSGVCGTSPNAPTGSPPVAFGSAPLASSNLTKLGRGDSLPAAQCRGVKFASASLALTFAPRAISNSAASKLSLQQACDNGLPK